MSNDPQPLRPYNKNEPYELTKKNILNPHKLNKVTTNEPKNVSNNTSPSSAAPLSVPRRRRPKIAPMSLHNSINTSLPNPVSIPSTAASASRPRRRIRFVPVHNSNTYEYLQELPNGSLLEITARHNGTIVSSRPYESPPPSTGGRKRGTKKHHKKARRTHRRRN